MGIDLLSTRLPPYWTLTARLQHPVNYFLVILHHSVRRQRIRNTIRATHCFSSRRPQERVHPDPLWELSSWNATPPLPETQDRLQVSHPCISIQKSTRGSLPYRGGPLSTSRRFIHTPLTSPWSARCTFCIDSRKKESWTDGLIKLN